MSLGEDEVIRVGDALKVLELGVLSAGRKTRRTLAFCCREYQYIYLKAFK
jgi:hypothetical protein